MTFNTPKDAWEFVKKNFSKVIDQSKKVLPYSKFLYFEKHENAFSLNYETGQEKPFILLSKEDIETGLFFDWASPFLQGLAAVRKKEKWLILNKNGEITPYTPEQEDLLKFSIKNAHLNKQYGFIDRNSNISTPPQKLDNFFSEEFAPMINHSNKYGFFDQHHNQLYWAFKIEYFICIPDSEHILKI